jgi:hypothetical protein
MTGLVSLLLLLALFSIAPVKHFLDGTINQLGSGSAGLKFHLLQALKDFAVDPRAEECLCDSPGHSCEHPTNVSQPGENAHSCITFARVIRSYSAGRVTPFGVTDAPGRKAVPQGQEFAMFTNHLSRGIYLARRRRDGQRIGLLVMNGSGPVAFVQASDDEGMKAAKCIDRNAGFAGREFLHGCRVNDLREVRVAGLYIDVPAYLFTAFLNPVDSAGRIVPMAQCSDVGVVCVEAWRDTSAVRFTGYRWIDRADVPKWMKGEVSLKPWSAGVTDAECRAARLGRSMETKSGKSADSTIAATGIARDEKSTLLTAAA